MASNYTQTECEYGLSCNYDVYTNEYMSSFNLTNMYFCSRHMRFHYCGANDSSNCILTDDGICYFSHLGRNPITVDTFDHNASHMSSLIGSTGTKLAELSDLDNYSISNNSSLLESEYTKFYQIVYTELISHSETFRSWVENELEMDNTKNISKKETLCYNLIGCIHKTVKECADQLWLSDEKLLYLLREFIKDISMPKNKYHFNDSPKDSGVSLQKKNMLFSNIFVNIHKCIKKTPDIRLLVT